MKVVFLQDVPNVASAGTVKKVADGYARNYLFPKKLAVLATPAEMQKLEARSLANARRQAEVEQEAQAFAQVLEELTVVLKVRAGTKDRIYGSVTNTAIAKEIKRLTGHDLDKHIIEIEQPIKVLGSHKVSVKLTKNVTAALNILVEPKEVKEEEKEPKDEVEQLVEEIEKIEEVAEQVEEEVEQVVEEVEPEEERD
ncbi:MAG: 50S ribosomal protein L9 [Dehalococcoidia bacterium]|nr:MAG: 50S ribosomal protein L9 [Dehalococcoidia bacterium]